MTTSVVAGRSQVVALPETAVRLTVMLACLAFTLGCWWAFAQLIVRVVS
jgi:hypothetical protein